MTGLLGMSSVLITLALVFYSIGVWAERIQRYLKGWHVVAFWLGLAFDTAGTYGMSLLTDEFHFWDFHTLTGQIAIYLMLGHAIWATVVVVRNQEEARTRFHKFSLFVWLVWLVPYFGGMIVGMGSAA